MQFSLTTSMAYLAMLCMVNLYFYQDFLIGMLENPESSVEEKHLRDPHHLADNSFTPSSEESKSKVIHQLPPVLLLGAQKSGSTALSNWFFDGGYHKSRVFDGEPSWRSKEPHFFDHDQEFEKGIEFYASRFQNDGGEYVGPAMDATPNTFLYPERVHATYSKAGGNQINDLRMIVVLRDPVARELSLYNHKVMDFATIPVKGAWYMGVGREDGSVMSFDEYVDKLYHRESTSYYAKHLAKWFKLFNRQQILVLSYEELKQDSKTLHKRVQEFLGHDIPGQKLKKANEKDSKLKVLAPSPEAREKLLETLRPQYQELYELLDKFPGPPMEQRPFPRFPED